MGLLFDLVREGITAREAAEAYGLAVNRYGKAFCPWHDDSRPSLSFKGNFCKCFACNNGGSAIDLTARLFSITPLEAARKLNNDFRIGADVSPSERPIGPSKAEIQALTCQAFNFLWRTWCDRERAERAILASYGPEDADKPEFSAALARLANAQETLERLNIDGLEALKEWAIPSTHSLSH